MNLLGKTLKKLLKQKSKPGFEAKKLKSHPWVEEACVVGTKGKGGGILQAVIITPEPSMLKEIIDDVNKNLEDYQQILEASVWPNEDFPRTPILKIDRKNVLEWVMGKEKNYIFFLLA